MRGSVIRLAKKNAGLGYRRTVGELRKLRLKPGRSSVRRTLKNEGFTPSPLRRGQAGETTWQKSIRLHVNTLVACDGDYYRIELRYAGAVACIALREYDSRGDLELADVKTRLLRTDSRPVGGPWTASGAMRTVDPDFDGDYGNTDKGLDQALGYGWKLRPGTYGSGIENHFGHQGLI